MKIRKTLAEREAYVAEQIAKRSAQQTPQAAPEPQRQTRAQASRKNLTQARRYRHVPDPWAPRPLTGTERSRRSRAKQ